MKGCCVYVYVCVSEKEGEKEGDCVCVCVCRWGQERVREKKVSEKKKGRECVCESGKFTQ